MFGKFIFFFIAVSCASQGYEARSFFDFPLSIDDIIKEFQQLVDKINEALKGLKDVLANLKDKIEEIIKQLNIPELINKVKEAIKEILSAAQVDPAQAAHCITNAENELANLGVESEAALGNCVKTAESVEQDIQKKVDDLVKKAETIISEITANVTKCIKDNGLDIPNTIKCLQGLTDPIYATVENFLKDVETAMNESEELINNAVNDLTDCVMKVEHDTATKETEIINNFQKCVDDIVNQGTTPAKKH